LVAFGGHLVCTGGQYVSTAGQVVSAVGHNVAVSVDAVASGTGLVGSAGGWAIRSTVEVRFRVNDESAARAAAVRNNIDISVASSMLQHGARRISNPPVFQTARNE
jgi:hypothetical protein